MTTFTAVYPRLVVRDAAAAIDFYAKVFEAEELERHTGDDGKIQHAMLRIGGVQVAVKDEDDYDPGPQTLGGSPVIMAVEVDDADAVGERMTSASGGPPANGGVAGGGGSVIFPIQDWDYGQRGGRLADPYGHLWMIAQNL